MKANTEILLREAPRAELREDHFEIRQGAIPEIGDGQVLVRTILISLDAANRAWMQGATYREAVKPGDVMHGYILGEVVQSKVDGFAAGELVAGEGRWANFVAIKASRVAKLPAHRPFSNLISVFGIAGKTAYHGLTRIGAPQAGETVVVSAAAGSVGSLVGQMAKALGARAVGIAGGPEKCRWLVDQLGFDAALDYKAGNLFADLKRAVPQGIDVYFDNVGGAVLEAVLFRMNQGGRIVCCGAVSQYDTDRQSSPRGLPGLIVVKRLKMQGFIVMDYAEHDATAVADMAQWIADGKLQVIEDVIDGLEAAPRALIGLLAGENRGKRMVRVAPDPD